MKRNIDKVKQVVIAWETLAPAKTFGGLTLEQFKARTKPSFDLRNQIDVLDNQSIDVSTRRNDADTTSNSAALLVVNAVKGDPEHGEDSALYAAMGYVRKSDRQSGLMRNAQPPAPPTPTAVTAAVK